MDYTACVGVSWGETCQAIYSFYTHVFLRGYATTTIVAIARQNVAAGRPLARQPIQREAAQPVRDFIMFARGARQSSTGVCVSEICVA